MNIVIVSLVLSPEQAEELDVAETKEPSAGIAL